eukprot:EC687594.1.p1 GENE.EC687594.1~~EC687594.1.p1  ORF type:complete len:133 (+),score=45.74 EC687594.1:23-421(+)
MKPIVRPTIVKKRVKQFKRHHSDRYDRLKESWRRPKGIDGCVRRKYRGNIPMPNCGYGSNKKTRNTHPDGLYQFVVHNVNELNALMMQNRKYSAVIAASVSARKTKEIVERASQLSIKVVNKDRRTKKEEAK